MYFCFRLSEDYVYVFMASYLGFARYHAATQWIGIGGVKSFMGYLDYLLSEIDVFFDKDEIGFIKVVFRFVNS